MPYVRDTMNPYDAAREVAFMLFCSNCAKQLEDGARFCNGCGVTVAVPQRVTSSDAAAAPALALRDSKKGGRLALKGFVLAIIIEIIGIAISKNDVSRIALSVGVGMAIGATYIMVSLSIWKKNGNPVKGKAIGWIVAVLLLMASLGGLTSIGGDIHDTAGADNSSASLPLSPRIVRPSIPRPKFRVYKSSDETPSQTSVVVPSNTTDEQLKSLLWFFREHVRAHDFKPIGIAEHRIGLLAVYRGEKCANEPFLESAGPCGYGEHEDADYQWGIEGDYDKDYGSIRRDGNDVSLFDYHDGWQLPPEIQARLDEQAKLGQAGREIFAQELQTKMTGMGYDITVWVHGEGADSGRELELDSEMFNDTATRLQFINGILPSWKRDLCKTGFRAVRIRRGGSFELGNAYSLACNS